MKKLRRFEVKNCRMLSHEEMAMIAGGLDISAVDKCTYSTIGQACVYSVSYDYTGHYSVKLGTCAVTYEQVGSVIETRTFCK